MIDTTTCKEQQLRDGFFHIGDGSTEIMIIGSCRTVPYVDYLSHSPGLTVRRIDPCDWTVSGYNLESLETDERILKVLKSTQIFIHEYLVNYEMFNTEMKSKKNIYQFGMEPLIDIMIPNFNDHMILENDYAAYGAVTPENYIERGWDEIDKFIGVCDKSSFPEFGDVFRDTWMNIRYFYRPNHTSAAFSKAIFKLMDENFLKLGINDPHDDDIFSYPNTIVTDRDREAYKITW